MLPAAGAESVRHIPIASEVIITSVLQSVSSLSSFFLAMVLHPEVQQRAREELDRVVGRGRLPDFTDRDSLPYITAITKEVLRYVTFTCVLPTRLVTFRENTKMESRGALR